MLVRILGECSNIHSLSKMDKRKKEAINTDKTKQNLHAMKRNTTYHIWNIHRLNSWPCWLQRVLHCFVCVVPDFSIASLSASMSIWGRSSRDNVRSEVAIPEAWTSKYSSAFVVWRVKQKWYCIRNSARGEAARFNNTSSRMWVQFSSVQSSPVPWPPGSSRRYKRWFSRDPLPVLCRPLWAVLAWAVQFSPLITWLIRET